MNVNSKQKSIYKITVCAVMIALGTVLSLIKVWEMPLGGSITPLSMLPNAFISVMYGLPWGLVAAFVSSALQLFLSLGEVLSWGLTPASLIGTLLLDYIIAYTVVGFAGIWRKNGYMGVCIGTAFAIILRFICHYISGVIIFDIWCPWANVWVYSLCYNGAYMLPELILTVIGAVLLFRSKQIKRFAGVE
ncbi:MAG: proton-coupled thiamine transporter YuaJ [Ruminococcaceae bacterium]|nr:proton-coupled thiamine transporter YuaJ [Oscillospiraceae bacterium]